jgi:hypothetical protein
MRPFFVFGHQGKTPQGKLPQTTAKAHASLLPFMHTANTPADCACAKPRAATKLLRSLFIFAAGAALLLPAIVFLGLGALFEKLAGLSDAVSWRLEEAADALDKKWETKGK